MFLADFGGFGKALKWDFLESRPKRSGGVFMGAALQLPHDAALVAEARRERAGQPRAGQVTLCASSELFHLYLNSF